MRWVLGLVWFLGCGGIISTSSDAGVDGSITGACASDSDCAAGYVCEYPVSSGCSATKQCFPNVQCKGGISCACDGTTVTACGSGAPKPIAHAGPCGGDDVIAPPPCGSSVACEICDLSGFTPTNQAKPIAASGACSSTQIVDFVNACLAPSATAATCQAWQQSDAGACKACVFTTTTAATWGPLVCDSQSCIVNEGGCLDITFNQVSKETGAGGSGSCGDLYNAEFDCIDYACNGCVSGSDFMTCSNDATVNECKSYVDATNAPNGPCGVLDAGASACFPQGSSSDYAAFVNVFCGTGP